MYIFRERESERSREKLTEMRFYRRRRQAPSPPPKGMAPSVTKYFPPSPICIPIPTTVLFFLSPNVAMAASTVVLARYA